MPDKCCSKPLPHNNDPFLLLCILAYMWGGGMVVLPGHRPTIIVIKMEHPYNIEFQVFDHGVNLTLQATAKIICGSLNQLADNGVTISQEPWPSNLQIA